MAPKKAAKPNGFVLFAQELQKQHGRKYPSLKEACDGAAPLWHRMSSDQREPYNQRAKGMRGDGARYTSEGLNVEDLTREEQMRSQAEENARLEIRQIITMAQKKNALDSEVFFLIHCNIFCYYPNEDRYWPAEIAVVCFTLKEGVKPENIFHFDVKPGPLPIGFKFEAKQHSDETHLMEIPFDDDQIDNKSDVYYNLKAFLEKKKSPGTKRMPILFADKKYLKVVHNILNTWGEDYDNEPDLFKVYNLQVMLYFLRNAAARDQVWTSITFSEREFEKDPHAYVPEIACSFHSTTFKQIFCSQSIVIRYAYTICDNCCPDLNIEYIEGQHIPMHSVIPDSVSTFGSSTSSRSSQSGRSSRRVFDNDFETDSNTDTWETESIASNTSTSTLMSNMDDQFPTLGKSKSISHASNSSDYTTNNSNARSYAGATGKSSLPPAFEQSMGDLSLNSSKGSTVGGRGFRRRINDTDSDVSSTSGAGFKSYASTASSDFPPIGFGRGRGFIPRTFKKPGAQTNSESK